MGISLSIATAKSAHSKQSHSRKMKLALILTALAVANDAGPAPQVEERVIPDAGPAPAQVEDAAPPEESSGNEAAEAPAPGSDYQYGGYRYPSYRPRRYGRPYRPYRPYRNMNVPMVNKLNMVETMFHTEPSLPPLPTGQWRMKMIPVWVNTDHNTLTTLTGVDGNRQTDEMEYFCID